MCRTQVSDLEFGWTKSQMSRPRRGEADSRQIFYKYVFLTNNTFLHFPFDVTMSLYFKATELFRETQLVIPAKFKCRVEENDCDYMEYQTLWYIWGTDII